MKAIIITAIICMTIVIISYINKNGGDNRGK